MHHLNRERKTIVVVFCYNVEKNIYALLNKIKKKRKNYNVLNIGSGGEIKTIIKKNFKNVFDCAVYSNL